jgi:hypothetical protein
MEYVTIDKCEEYRGKYDSKLDKQEEELTSFRIKEAKTSTTIQNLQKQNKIQIAILGSILTTLIASFLTIIGFIV